MMTLRIIAAACGACCDTCPTAETIYITFSGAAAQCACTAQVGEPPPYYSALQDFVMGVVSLTKTSAPEDAVTVWEGEIPAPSYYLYFYSDSGCTVPFGIGEFGTTFSTPGLANTITVRCNNSLMTIETSAYGSSDWFSVGEAVELDCGIIATVSE